VKSYTLSHLTDAALLRDLDTRLSEHHGSTASLVAHLAEVDARRLYLPAGYSSMFAFCVGRLHMSEDAAYKRIQAARLSRSFPGILEALAEGRLHLAGVCLLAPHLTPENSGELIAAATHRSKAQIELLLAQRFPQPDLVPSIAPLAIPSAPQAICPEHVCEEREQLAPGQVHVPLVEQRATVKPLAPQRFGMQVTIDAETEALLRDVQALLGHAIPSGDLATVLRESLKLAKQALEKRRYAQVSEPRPGRRTKSERHIPAHVRREVWKRDEGRCTFVAENGHRCEYARDSNSITCSPWVVGERRRSPTSGYAAGLTINSKPNALMAGASCAASANGPEKSEATPTPGDTGPVSSAPCSDPGWRSASSRAGRTARARHA
jgi:hypothetical protein